MVQGGFLSRVLFAGIMAWILVWSGFGFGCGSVASRIRQRSDGCGPHPLIALVAASRPFGSGNTTPSLNEIIRAVRADPDAWSELQALVQRYDDCIRAGDGLHYKRNTFPPVINQETAELLMGTDV